MLTVSTCRKSERGTSQEIRRKPIIQPCTHEQREELFLVPRSGPCPACKVASKSAGSSNKFWAANARARSTIPTSINNQHASRPSGPSQHPTTPTPDLRRHALLVITSPAKPKVIGRDHKKEPARTRTRVKPRAALGRWKGTRLKTAPKRFGWSPYTQVSPHASKDPTMYSQRVRVGEIPISGHTRHTHELAKHSEYPRLATSGPCGPFSTRRRQMQTSMKAQPSPQACAAPEDAIAIPDLHDVRRSFAAVGACAERRRTTSQTDASVLLQRPNAPPANVNTKGCIVMLVVGLSNGAKDGHCARLEASHRRQHSTDSAEGLESSRRPAQSINVFKKERRRLWDEKEIFVKKASADTMRLTTRPRKSTTVESGRARQVRERPGKGTVGLKEERTRIPPLVPTTSNIQKSRTGALTLNSPMGST
ncbi:hypothetical protein D9611_007377 [Ephemerocybe angulata]|uniref:Uncharacterized protein n=1 Tax=Ephemerocybe angulata TaxID=980116 RepID=A0A8H5CF99_9AGAR|nr:hypothetical protein D9611_007377 [Tulosesus angulatus]